MISPATGRGKLYGTLKDLRLRWEDTERLWDDPVRRDFEENIWIPLVGQAQAAIRGIDRLEQVLRQMQNECE
jgi:hypothetical protein